MSIKSFVELLTGSTATKHADNGLTATEIQQEQQREAGRLNNWAMMAASLHRN